LRQWCSNLGFKIPSLNYLLSKRLHHYLQFWEIYVPDQLWGERCGL
jgi:hypothetical protein